MQIRVTIEVDEQALRNAPFYGDGADIMDEIDATVIDHICQHYAVRMVHEVEEVPDAEQR